MKRSIVVCMLLFFFTLGVKAQQEQSKRVSPPDSTSVITSSGVTIKIHYSKPSIKGRTLGQDIVPLGKVWRTGANEATTFEINKDVTIDGKALAAGKYSLHSIPGETRSTIIFNKIWKKSGLEYDEKEDALKVDVSTGESSDFYEQFKIKAEETGLVELLWGNYKMYFTVK